MAAEKIMLLVRHAKSSHDIPYLEDKLRTLADRGKADAQLIGARLRSLQLVPNLVYSSTAVRTKATITILNQHLIIPEGSITYHDDLYTFHDTGDTYVNYLHKTSNDKSSVMILSHNGSCLNVAYQITDGEISSFPTCAVLICRWQVQEWSEVRLDNVSSYQMITPKELR